MPRLLELAPGRFAHPGGALWLPAFATALVADVHLGYAWAQRRRGELAPPVEGGVRNKLEALVEELHPVELVVIGDLVHAPKPAAAERTLIEGTIRSLSLRTRVTLVPGNHDRGFLRDFPQVLHVAEQWRQGNLIAVHGHAVERCVPGTHLVIGHIHPAVGIVDDAGAYQKIPVFIAGPNATVLPAFSPFAAGVALEQALTPRVSELIGSPMRLIAATGKQVVEISGRTRSYSEDRE